MNKFEANLVELAESYYKEAIGWAEEDGTSQVVVDLANESEMTVDELSGINLSHLVTKLLTICDLTTYDTELSDETRATLETIEKNVQTLKRQAAEEAIQD